VQALYFGTYDRASPRNTQVISCLRGAGVEVLELHREVWERHNWSLGFGQLARVLRAERDLARRHEEDADVVVVGYPGHFDMRAARRVARGRPIVFNPLVSLHDTIVGDRGRFRARSPAAGIVKAVDQAAFRAADLVVADTEAHAAFFRRVFGLAEERVAVALVGADEPLFRPGWHPPEPFHALFVGKLIPLHGLETILAAAELAPELDFRIVGDGQQAPLLEERPANVSHIPWLDYEELPDAYRAAGCALGIFGVGDKAARVIPNKAYQALACARPLITASTPASRELLTDGSDALLVPPGEPVALVEALRRVAGEPELAERLATAGRATYEARASEEVLGRRWRALLEQALQA